jgi:putative transposase
VCKGSKRVIRAHKIRLHPTAEQYTYLIKAAGAAGYAYHWTITQWREAAGKKPTALKKRFNAEKPDWVYEVTKSAAEGTFTDFGAALTNFYDERAGKPQFKKRSKGHFKFKLNNDKFDVFCYFVKVPKLCLVKMAEKLRYSGKIIGASCKAQWRYVSITVETPDQHTLPKVGKCSVHAGLLRRTLLKSPSGSGYNERVTPPQTGYNLNKHNDNLPMSDHVCRSERKQ